MRVEEKGEVMTYTSKQRETWHNAVEESGDIWSMAAALADIVTSKHCCTVLSHESREKPLLAVTAESIQKWGEFNNERDIIVTGDIIGAEIRPFYNGELVRVRVSKMPPLSPPIVQETEEVRECVYRTSVLGLEF